MTRKFGHLLSEIYEALADHLLLVSHQIRDRA